MAALSSIDLLLLLLLSSLLITPALSYTASSTPVTPATACNSTLYPSFCRSILPKSSHPLCAFALFSTSKSLATSSTHLSILTRFLKKNRPKLSRTAAFALEDCQLLTQLTTDSLSKSNSTLTATALSDVETEDIHTLLSSTLTNLQTCLDDLFILNQTAINNRVYNRLSNDTMLYSVGLGLFAQAWVQNYTQQQPTSTNNRRKLLSQFHEAELGKNGLLLKMKSSDREVYERSSGRRLLQAPSGVLVSKMVVVSRGGGGNFTTITAAVSSAPNNTDGSKGYYLIYVKAGVYQEYVSIPSNKKYVMMVGDGINRTVVSGNRSVVDGWTTFNSATFSVVAQGFVAVNMTIRNTAGAIKQQAVALRSGADLSTFYRCSFEGYQDTLYTHSMRQFYRECDIYGTVDFIFGNAAVVLQNCNIYPRLPMRGQSDPITAQGRTDPNQNTGTSVLNCSIKAAPDLAANNGTTKVYLGRPWKEYSRTVFMQSFLDKLIDPAGWLAWSGDFALSTLYYAEYNNTGPGSDTSKRVTWPGYHVIGRKDAVNFTVGNFLLGDVWLTQTRVPYFGGLL